MANDSLTTADIGDQVLSADVRDDFRVDGLSRHRGHRGGCAAERGHREDTLTGPDVSDNILTGADVDESTLGFPGAIKTFAGAVSPGSNPPVGPDYVFRGPTVSVSATAAQPRITLGAGLGPACHRRRRSGLGRRVTSASVGTRRRAPGLADELLCSQWRRHVHRGGRNPPHAVGERLHHALPRHLPGRLLREKPAGNVVTGNTVNGWVMQSG